MAGIETISGGRIPESQKDLDWYKARAKEMVGRAAILSTPEANQAWSYYLNTMDIRRDSPHLSIHPSGAPYPVNMINMRFVKPLAERMLGEFVENGLRFTVAPISPSAISRHQQGISRMRTQYNLSPFLQNEAESFPGVATLGQDTPTSPEGLARWERDFKEMNTIIHQRLLDDYLHKGNFMLSVQEAFESMLVTGSGWLRLSDSEIGTKEISVEDWRVVIFDQMCRYDLKGATFVGTMKYTKVRELATKYGLSKSDSEKLNHGGTLSLPTIGANIPVSQPVGGEKYALEIHIEFRDQVPVSLLEREGNYVPIKSLLIGDKGKKQKGKASQTWATTIREVVLLGDDLVVRAGRKPHYRPREEFWKSGFDMFAYLHMWKDGRASGPIMDCVPAMILGNEAMQKLRHEMHLAIGKVQNITSDSIPKDMDWLDADSLARVMGVRYMRQANLGANSSYASSFASDMSMSDSSVNAYMQVINLSRRLIHDLFGVSEGSLGQGDVARVATDVASSAARNSSYLTRRLFAGGYAMVEQALTCLMNSRHRGAQDKPEEYRHIIGDEGVRFLTELGIGYEDHGLTVDDSSLNEQGRQAVIRAVENGMANGMISAPDGIRIIMNRDPKEAVKYLEEREKEFQAMQQAAREEEANRQQAQTQAMLEREEQKDSARMQEKQISGEAQVQAAKEAAKGTILASEVNRDAKLRKP